jgi:hypothetical protein
MKLYVNICFHYVEKRLKYLNEVIASINEISTEQTIIIVNSNELFECESMVNVAHGLKHPWHLTWEHKKYMQEFLKTDYTHYMYLEDDIKFTKQTMNYWLKTKELFDKNGFNFIPAIHRIEYKNGIAMSLDSTKKPVIRNSITIEEQKFVFLPEPYQGMFIMTRQDVMEHLNSQYAKIGVYKGFSIRESANLGNMYLNVPKGYLHRAIVPVEGFERCWVHHLSNNYADELNSRHAKIPAKELLDGN